jgi:hypothetical protein
MENNELGIQVCVCTTKCVLSKMQIQGFVDKDEKKMHLKTSLLTPLNYDIEP